MCLPGRRVDGRGGRRKRRDVAGAAPAVAATAVGGIVVLWLSVWSPPSRRPAGMTTCRPPVAIRLFDLSAADDVGGWMSPYPFRSPASSMLGATGGDAAGDGSSADYGGLKFTSLVGGVESSEFRRAVDPGDEGRWEDVTRRGWGGEDEPPNGVWQVWRKHLLDDDDDDDEEAMDPVCRRTNWSSLHRPNCNLFHEFDLARGFEEKAVRVSEEQGYDSYYVW